METAHLDELLTSREAAAMLRLSERTLERHRTSGTGSRYIALGGAVRYRRRDLLDWIEKARVTWGRWDEFATSDVRGVSAYGPNPAVFGCLRSSASSS